MATTAELFNTLLTMNGDQVLEIPGVDPASAEYLRQQFVKKLSKYRTELDNLGVPKEAQPQSLRMNYDAGQQCAKFSIGARRIKRLGFSFNITSSSDEQASPSPN